MNASNSEKQRVASQSVFIGRLSEELNDLIASQAAAIFDEMGLIIPVKSCSLMVALEKSAPASARDLAQVLGRSHQLVSQKLPALVKLGLIERGEDPEDLRQKPYSLTSRGQEQLELFRNMQDRLEIVYGQLADEVGDLTGVLSKAIAHLHERSLSQRMAAVEGD